VDQANNDGLTPLKLAGKKDHQEVVKLLVAAADRAAADLAAAGRAATDRAAADRAAAGRAALEAEAGRSRGGRDGAPCYAGSRV